MLTSSEVTYRLAGSIRHMGLPITGVVVKLISVEPGRSAYEGELVGEFKTSGSGDFNFSVKAGKYGLIVVPDSNTCFVPRMFEGVNVSSNTVLNIALVTGVILKGKVLLPSSVDFSTVQVIALGIDPTEGRQSAPLDKNGRYNMVLPKGRYSVAVAAVVPDNRSQLKSVGFLTTKVETVDLARDAELVIDLTNMSRFKGRLQDGQGNAVATGIVTASPTANQANHLIQQFAFHTKCISNQGGEFDLNIDPAEYDFSIEPPEFAPLAETREEGVYLAAGSTKTFILNKGYRITGQVEFEGNPVRECVVEVTSSEKRLTSTVFTDSAGYFRLSVSSGIYEISILPKDRGEGKLPAPQSKTVIVESDQELAFQLKPGVSVQGFIKDKLGEPRPDVKISLTPENGGKGQPVLTTTAADGSYFLVAEPGRYLVRLNNDKDKVEPIVVTEAGLNQDFVCQGACVVRLKVVAEDEEAVAGCHVAWGPYGHHEGQLGLFAIEESSLNKGAAITDHNGICQMTLAEGVYTFRFLPPSESSCDERTIRQLSISGDMKRKVKLTFKTS